MYHLESNEHLYFAMTILLFYFRHAYFRVFINRCYVLCSTGIVVSARTKQVGAGTTYTVTMENTASCRRYVHILNLSENTQTVCWEGAQPRCERWGTTSFPLTSSLLSPSFSPPSPTFSPQFLFLSPFPSTLLPFKSFPSAPPFPLPKAARGSEGAL